VGGREQHAHDDDGSPAAGCTPTVGQVGDDREWDRFAAEARHEEAAAARAREGWLRRAAGDDATLSGTLLDLAERGAPALLTLRSGRRHRVSIWRVASDCVAVRHDDGRMSWVALRAIAVVGGEPGGRAVPVGTRRAESDVTFVDVLSDLVADQATVALFVGDMTDALRGRLIGGGRDVVRVATTGPTPEVVVAVQAVSEVALVDSG
jgi:hypothetical protein